MGNYTLLYLSIPPPHNPAKLFQFAGNALNRRPCIFQIFKKTEPNIKSERMRIEIKESSYKI